MADNTVYLITGANRGIGLAVTASLLKRPNTTVIATVRNIETSVEALQALAIEKESRLVVEYLSTDNKHPVSKLAENLTKIHGLERIDVLIANAGISSFASVLEIKAETMLETFETNTMFPILLFQTLYPLLAKSASPKFVFNSSFLGSIGSLEDNPSRSLAYGMSKAAGNYFVRKVHFEFENVVSIAYHPGWSKTENGQNFADEIGAKEAPMTAEESAEGMIKQIDIATKASSGRFVSFNGSEVLW